jgi:zinc-ribbon domain
MFCPRCGAENSDTNRFCVDCGTELNEKQGNEAGGNGPRERFKSLIGTTRQARLVTAAIAVALIIALAAFLSLGTDEEGTATSAYLEGLDRICVAEKERISGLETEALSRQAARPQEFASVLVTALAEWRESMRQASPPAADREETQALESALLVTMVKAAKLSRLIREGVSAAAIDDQARAVDESTGNLDRTIEGIGLPVCADLQVAPSA